MKKSLLCILLALVLVFSYSVACLAEDAAPPVAEGESAEGESAEGESDGESAEVAAGAEVAPAEDAAPAAEGESAEGESDGESAEDAAPVGEAPAEGAAVEEAAPAEGESDDAAAPEGEVPAEGESAEGESEGESAEGESDGDSGDIDMAALAEQLGLPERTPEDEERMALKQAFDPANYTGVIVPAPDNDMHNDLMYSYLMDEDINNVFAYGYGVEQNSIPKGIICDFSEDGIEDAAEYVIQRASDADFTDPVTVTGLTEKTYTFYNFLLGETFYWRAGTSVDALDASPVHEVTVADLPPRVIYIEGCQNVRDIGGYESSLVPGGKIRQGLYYRGEHIDNITEAGKEVFRDQLGIRVEIDMRDEDRCLGPFVEGVDYYAYSIPSGTESYRFNEYSSVYKGIFELISKADEGPIYLHCSSGADRTGIVTFILLTLCGVSYEDMAIDYLFTNFTDEEVRLKESEFDRWYSRLDLFAGETKSEQAANWLRLKGVPDDQIERIKEVFVEGYVSPEE